MDQVHGRANHGPAHEAGHENNCKCFEEPTSLSPDESVQKKMSSIVRSRQERPTVTVSFKSSAFRYSMALSNTFRKSGTSDCDLGPAGYSVSGVPWMAEPNLSSML